MKYDDYKGLIDFALLRTAIRDAKITDGELAERLGCSVSSLRNYIHNRQLPDTEVLAKICAALQCSVDKVVSFTGYEVKDRFKTSWDGYGKPRWNGLTYEPLRMLFRGTYADNWRQKLSDFFDTIPRPELSDKQKDSIGKMLKARNDQIQEAIATGKHKGSNNWYKNHDKGLMYEYRYNIASDDPIPLPRLYDICKALHCTPDWVMTYN